MKKMIPLVFTLTLASACLSACSSHTVTPQLELEASMATTSWFIENMGVVKSQDASALMSRVTSRLTQATMTIPEGKGYLDEYAASAPWQIYLLDTPKPNAFSVGSGAIIVTRGMITQLDSEADFAAVLAHEMAHQILGHTNEAIYQADQRSKSQCPAPQPQYTFSLDQELAADKLGLLIIERAQYNPGAVLRALSLAFRPLERSSVGDDTAWLDARTAALYPEVARCEKTDVPKTDNSREFQQVRQELAKQAS